jgi:hypothetical protein
MNIATSLETLYDTHTGLVSDKWELYLAEYDRLFSSLRNKPIGLLEVGVQNGGSLEIWAQYFSAAEAIVGCDINPLCGQLTYNDDRVRVVIGDITEPGTIKNILKGRDSFDIIIDDGSHTSTDIIISFCKLFPQLKSGGIYIIEDLHCSYWKQFEGGLTYPQSSMFFFKALTDVINFEHWGFQATRLQNLKPFGISSELTDGILAELHSVEFVNSMCILKKKDKSLNILGKRRVVGQSESVAPVKYVANTYNRVPEQTQQDDPYNAQPLEDKNLQAADEINAIQQQRIKYLETRQAELEAELVRKDG